MSNLSRPHHIPSQSEGAANFLATRPDTVLYGAYGAAILGLEATIHAATGHYEPTIAMLPVIYMARRENKRMSQWTNGHQADLPKAWSAYAGLWSSALGVAITYAATEHSLFGAAAALLTASKVAEGIKHAGGVNAVVENYRDMWNARPRRAAAWRTSAKYHAPSLSPLINKEVIKEQFKDAKDAILKTQLGRAANEWRDTLRSTALMAAAVGYCLYTKQVHTWAFLAPLEPELIRSHALEKEAKASVAGQFTSGTEEENQKQIEKAARATPQGKLAAAAGSVFNFVLALDYAVGTAELVRDVVTKGFQNGDKWQLAADVAITGWCLYGGVKNAKSAGGVKQIISDYRNVLWDAPRLKNGGEPIETKKLIAEAKAHLQPHNLKMTLRNISRFAGSLKM